MQTVDAIVDAEGHLQLVAPIPPGKARKAVLTIFDETPTLGASETALLSEAALAKDWNRPEEDAAWSYLQPAK